MLPTILKWVAIVMMADSAIGILGLHFWNRHFPNINIQKIALIEATLAVAILSIAIFVR